MSVLFFPAIRVDWQMFNIVQEENKLVDLITPIGDPFPLKRVSSLAAEDESSASLEGSAENDEEKNESGPLIRILLKPHEGVPSLDPFDISPKQMVRIYPMLLVIHVFLLLCLFLRLIILYERWVQVGMQNTRS